MVALVSPIVTGRRNVLTYGGAMLLAMVVVGGHLMVTGGVGIARSVGISGYVVGLLAGLGTTAPEIVVASIAARKGSGGISVGALLGSNITGPVFSLGVGALVAPAVTDLVEVTASTTYVLAASVVVLGLLYWREGIDRYAAVACLALYLPSFFVG